MMIHLIHLICYQAAHVIKRELEKCEWLRITLTSSLLTISNLKIESYFRVFSEPALTWKNTYYYEHNKRKERTEPITMIWTMTIIFHFKIYPIIILLVPLVALLLECRIFVGIIKRTFGRRIFQLVVKIC